MDGHRVSEDSWLPVGGERDLGCVKPGRAMDVCLIVTLLFLHPKPRFCFQLLIPSPCFTFGFGYPNQELDQGQMLPLFGRQAIPTQPSAESQIGLLK